MSAGILETTQLGAIVTAYPSTSRVLLANGLDFCCGGKQTVGAAARRKGLSPEALLHALNAEAASKPPGRDWTAAPLDELIGHIIAEFHVPLPQDLAQLEAMADKVERTHGDKDPERLGALAQAVRSLAGELLPHLAKEEQILFPWILSSRQPAPAAPIQCMEAEHDAAGTLLQTIRDLTDGFQPPEGACTTWRNLYARLEKFDLDLRNHIHLENNVLHPRALGA